MSTTDTSVLGEKEVLIIEWYRINSVLSDSAPKEWLKHHLNFGANNNQSCKSS